MYNVTINILYNCMYSHKVIKNYQNLLNLMIFFIVLTVPVKFIGKNYATFFDLPSHMKRVYTLKSYKIMAEWIFDECYDILFNFVNKKTMDVCFNITFCKIFLDV